MKTVICSLALCLHIAYINAAMFHQQSPIKQEWKEENLDGFDELMISWNTSRPPEGKFDFYVSVKINEWSPWLLYASWGSNGQSSFLNTIQGSSVRVYQDALEVLDGKKATGFQVKIVAEGSAHVDKIHGLHVYTNGDQPKELQTSSCLKSVYLKVPGLSQITVDHPRPRDLCSPVSTTAVIRYLLNDNTINPSRFAQNVWDNGFDIFGNWVFNTAQASVHLGDQWNCWVEKLHGFNDVYHYLEKGTPVVVSVRGPLQGSALPYAKGHLLAIIGYDPSNQKVICMDPAFPKDSDTHVTYDLSDFIQAWNRRGKVAYIFSKKGS